MKRTILPTLTLILAASLSACGAGQAIQTTWQTAVHPCPEANLGNILWSPDGTRIAYTFYFAEDDHITYGAAYTADVQTRASTRLTEADGSLYLRLWSPDGSLILVSHYPGYSLVNADGTYQRDLPYSSFFADSWTSRMAWSPDGRQIAYTVNPNLYIDMPVTLTGADWAGMLYVYDLDANVSTLIHLESKHLISSPSWSSDSAQITFAVSAVSYGSPDPAYDLMVVNRDGSDPRTLTEEIQESPPQPPLESSGVKIQKLANGDTVIVKVEPDGTSTTLVTLQLDETSYVLFSPDGSKIAYFESVSTGLDELYVMNIDGSNKIQLTQNPGHNTCFDWPF